MELSDSLSNSRSYSIISFIILNFLGIVGLLSYLVSKAKVEKFYIKIFDYFAHMNRRKIKITRVESSINSNKFYKLRTLYCWQWI